MIVFLASPGSATELWESGNKINAQRSIYLEQVKIAGERRE